jgi:hypothetical protein
LFCKTEEGEVVDGQAAVFSWISDQVQRRDPDGAKEKVCIMDGQLSLWDIKDLVQDGVETTEILDLLHVTSRVWRAAHVFYAKGSDAAENFVRDRVLRVLQGKTASVIRGLRRLATTRKVSTAKRQQIECICRYFDNNQERMRYDEYLRAGYPIASGVIEGACRYVVKDRLERAGMNWTIPGAQAMLQLRCLYINGQWESFIKYRIDRETARLYPYRGIVEQTEWALAA